MEAHGADDRSAAADEQAAARPSIEDVVGDTTTLQSAEDLARDGIFGEGEEFIADLYAMRRSDVA